MKISQREARKLKRRVRELENVLDEMRKNWREDWPAGRLFHRAIGADKITLTAIKTARLLRHAVVVMPSGDDLVYFGMQLPESE